jgi:hypothetical protein
MKAAPPSWLADPVPGPEVLIREARRRQRRRWLVAGVATAAVLTGAAAMIAGSGAGSRPGPGGRHAIPAAPAHAVRPTVVSLPGPILAGAATMVVMCPVGYPAFGPNSGLRHTWTT